MKNEKEERTLDTAASRIVQLWKEAASCSSFEGKLVRGV